MFSVNALEKLPMTSLLPDQVSCCFVSLCKLPTMVPVLEGGRDLLGQYLWVMHLTHQVGLSNPGRQSFTCRRDSHVYHYCRFIVVFAQISITCSTVMNSMKYPGLQDTARLAALNSVMLTRAFQNCKPANGLTMYMQCSHAQHNCQPGRGAIAEER